MSLSEQTARLRELQVPTIVLALLVALTTWSVKFDLPAAGLDPSSNAGLFMAAHQGLAFGTDLVYTYGPLGFLGQGNATLWYGDLAVIAFVYAAAMYLGFCVAIVWALRRSIGAIGAVVVAFAAISLLPGIEVALVAAVALALAPLVPERPRFALDALVAGGATFAALQIMIKLSIGPVVVVIFALALLGARAGGRRLALYLALLAIEIPLLWLLIGQDLGDLSDYAANSAQIISGYSEAMGVSGAPDWQVVAGALAVIFLAIATAFAEFRDSRARWCATALVALAGFAIFKEGVVRSDAVHLAILLSTATALFLLLPLTGARRGLLAGGGVALVVLTQIVVPAGYGPPVDPVASVRLAGDGVDLALSPAERERESADAKASLRAVYDIDERTLAELEAGTVAIEPWEAVIAWAYDLDWSPLPVFQGYAAYTSELDRLNADRAAAATGPDRILRVAPAVIGDALTRSIDGRLPSWDPPGQALAVLCHFEPSSTGPRYELLRRVGDRCGEAVAAGSVETDDGEAVPVPAAGRGEVVFARVEGAGVSGVEKLRSLLYRAAPRYVTLDGEGRVRLVPGTAGDGLLLRGDPRVVGTGEFAQAPQAESFAIEGAGDDLRVDFFRMPVG